MYLIDQVTESNSKKITSNKMIRFWVSNIDSTTFEQQQQQQQQSDIMKGKSCVITS